MELSLKFIELKLKVPWKLSRNTSLTKTNAILTLKKDGKEYYSEIAPNVRYNESPQKIEEEFKIFKDLLNTMSMEKALNAYAFSHSTRFALEALWLKSQNPKIHEFLKIPQPRSMPTSFSLPIMEINEIENYLKDISRFQHLKIKINQESSWEMVKEVSKFSKAFLRIDGNEAFLDYDQYRKFEEKCFQNKINVEFIEEPFPAANKDMYRKLKKETPYFIMADESIQNEDNLEEISQLFHAVNIKLMKTGSLLLARDFLVKARRLNLKTMLGCMIETSLGISIAMELNSLSDVIDLDGFLLIQEDPYKLVTEKDGILSLAF